MQIVVVGSGGREHALAEAFKRFGHTVTVTPGRHGMPNPTNTSPFDLEGELFIVGSENDLVDGQADRLRDQGKIVLAPGADGAQLEGSKIWMKSLLNSAGAPTARWGAYFPDHQREAEELLRSGEPSSLIVVKTDYLAGGKGVLVTNDVDIAVADALAKLGKGAIVIEDGLAGTELSYFAVCDVDTHILLPFAQDYKRLLTGDLGPNTGGMGSYAPVQVDQVLVEQIHDITDRVLAELHRRGIYYRGILYGGLMLTADGPYVLEYNIRLGDPETQVILPIMTADPAKLFSRAGAGTLAETGQVETQGACVCVVLAAEGYPTNPRKGDVISGIDDAQALDGVTVLHAGTEWVDDHYVTAGGRVLNVVAEAPTVPEARTLAYQAAELISWDGMQYRDDIAEGVE